MTCQPTHRAFYRDRNNRRMAGAIALIALLMHPADRRVYVGLWITTAIADLVFPMTGLAIVAKLAVEIAIIRTVPPLRRALG